jgi:hypothetical protein
VGGALGASVSFFLISNAAAWLWDPIYSKNLDGLIQSYAMGVPFFRFALAGDLFYTAVFFGIAAFVTGAKRSQVRLAA